MNLLDTCNNEYWRAAKGKSGAEAEIIVDLKCPIFLETFKIINGFGNFGTKEYFLFGARKITGPWAELHRGELSEGREMTEEV